MKKEQEKIISFYDYLTRIGLTSETVKIYDKVVKAFLVQNPDAPKFGYKEVLGYLEVLRKAGVEHANRIHKLGAIKKYYEYLIDQGIRGNHPCKTLFMKTPPKRAVIQSDLFTMNELESLFKTHSHFNRLKVKNEVVLSLLIYQALSSKEITSLKLHHVDLDAGTIFIRGDKRLAGRKLELNPRQIRLFDTYLSHDRKRLLKDKDSDFFIITLTGKRETSDGLCSFMERLRCKFPDRHLSTMSIRDSVISYLINKRNLPLEQVQTFAGHRWISSTQRYLHASVEAEREVLKMHHPLG
jgi:integrase/recombinase XerD